MSGSRCLKSAVRFCFLLALGIAQTSSAVTPEFHRNKANLLSSSGFKIHSKFEIWNLGQGHSSGEIELTETYQVGNVRALIEMKLPNSFEQSSLRYYVNGTNTKQLVRVNSTSKDCKEIDRDEMLTEMFSYLDEGARNSFIATWAGLVDGVPSFVLGMSRLLQYFDLHRDQMSLSDEQNIRDRPVTRYTLSSPFKESSVVSASLSQQPFISWNGAELPSRMAMQIEPSYLLMVDFFLAEPLESRMPFEDSEYYLDPTTVSLGLRCYAQSKQQILMPFREVYSMKVEIEDALDDEIPNRRLFIAHDGKQSAFRRDVLNEDGSPASLTIYDLVRLRRYNIMRSIKRDQQQQIVPLYNEDEEKDASGVIESEPTPTVDCVAGADSVGIAIAFMMPFKDFVYMGTGVVRGVEVNIYEQYNFQMPAMFFPPIDYVNELGQWRPLTDTLNVMDKAFGKLYSAVYYFARTAEQDPKYLAFGQLIRVDVMLGDSLLKKINVYDFVWQLAEGPNADREETLFAVPKVCHQIEGAQKVVAPELGKQISLNLHLNFSLASSVDISESDSMILLENPATRYKALSRGLTAASPEISSSRIMDVTSSMTKIRGQKFQMHSRVTLSIADGDAWQPKWVGTYVQLFPQREPIEGPTSFDECFFEAVRRRRNEQVLFAFIREACYIDDAPLFDERTDQRGAKTIEFTYSSVFRISRLTQTPNRAMTIELVRNKIKPRVREVQQRIQESLSIGKHLALPIVDTQHPKWLGDSILFFVSGLEQASLREEERPDDPNSDLNGLNIITGHRIERTPDGDEINFETCRAACLMDLNCNSYSVCTRGLETTCLISELNFDDKNLMGELRYKLNSNPRNKSDGEQWKFSYSAVSEANDAELEFIGGNQEHLTREAEIRIDKRCRIYKKRALEMFVEQPRQVVLLKGRTILQVDTEEECAKHCLKNNIQFFSKNLELPDLKDTNSSMIMRQHRKRLSSWCAMFRYLNLKTSSEAQSLLELKQMSKQEKSAICLLSKPRGGTMRVNPDAPKELDERAKVETDTFEFEYVNLYEPHHNFWIAYHPGTENQTNGNQRRVEMKDEMSSPEACARACFTQTIELVPYCKSFEFVQFKTIAGRTSEEMGEGYLRNNFMCAFNSMSLADIRRSGLESKMIAKPADPLISVTFYEPRQAFMLNDSLMRKLVEPDDNQTVYSRPLNTFLVFLLALACGVSLGLWAKKPLVEYWGNRHEGDAIARRKFSNGELEEGGENPLDIAQ